MAIYRYDEYVEHNLIDPAFDAINTPGTPAPFSGIYRCMVCGHEAVSTEGNPLPPQGTLHQHNMWQTSIRWRLVVYADHRQK